MKRSTIMLKKHEAQNTALAELDAQCEAVKAQRTQDSDAPTVADGIRALRQEQASIQDAIDTASARMNGLDAALNNSVKSAAYGGQPTLSAKQADGIRTELKALGRQYRALYDRLNKVKRQADALKFSCEVGTFLRRPV